MRKQMFPLLPPCRHHRTARAGCGWLWEPWGIAAVAAMASRVVDGAPALARLQQASVPLEAALYNDRPTVLEFYADWCEVCNELAPATLPGMTSRLCLVKLT